MTHADPRVQRIIDLYERLGPDDLARLGQYYLPDVWFKDPFNEVQGVDALRGIFEHMFETLDAPRFRVREALCEGHRCFLVWDFDFRWRGARGAPVTVHGASHLQFGTDGRVQRHRDYWDAAAELYAKLPVLGALMRWLRRRHQPGRRAGSVADGAADASDSRCIDISRP
jgi:ketosteroid isomerase-like protein